MRMLHYSLGFPPYRSGGLTKFCTDLMLQQVMEGNKVSLLWPGQIKLIDKRIRIKKHKSFGEIGNYEIINPLPVPYDEGIREVSRFIDDSCSKSYGKILDELRPDVVHVHTFMGLHKSFLYEVKKRKIRLVFSAHDFFPICPRVTMFKNGQICNSFVSCQKCYGCNASALNLNKIILLQSPLYRLLKESVIIKKLRKRHRDSFLNETLSNEEMNNQQKAKDYSELRNFYYSLLQMFDIIHYNSSVTKQVYEQVFALKNGEIVWISHLGIDDHRRIKEFDNNLRIRYLGPQSQGKGYLILKEACDRLCEDGKTFSLSIHFSPIEYKEYMRCNKRYTSSELKEIFDDTDVLVCPSVWYETFGFTVLEALSYGVPVIISGTVGAKDIVSDDSGVVIESINADKLYNVLREINEIKLKEMNKYICNNQIILTMPMVSAELNRKVYQN